MLESKMEGKLEPDEKQLLEATLTAVRFRFVQTGTH